MLRMPAEAGIRRERARRTGPEQGRLPVPLQRMYEDRPWRLDGLHGKECISVPRTPGNDDLSTQTQSQIA